MRALPRYRRLATAAIVLCSLEWLPAAACLLTCALDAHAAPADQHADHHSPAGNADHGRGCHGGVLSAQTPSVCGLGIPVPTEGPTLAVVFPSTVARNGPDVPLSPPSTTLLPEPPPPRA